MGEMSEPELRKSKANLSPRARDGARDHACETNPIGWSAGLPESQMRKTNPIGRSLKFEV
jgi:hypothetical protein